MSDDESKTTTTKKKDKPPPKERTVTTRHSILIDGQKVPYTATAGTIFLRDASGIYDLATPYFASMHTARHLRREPAIRRNIHESFFDAGHMMYMHGPSRAKLRDDLVVLITGG